MTRTRQLQWWLWKNEGKNTETEKKILELKSTLIDEEKIKSDIEKIDKEIKEIDKEIEEIEHDMTCPTCHQNIPEELQNELNLISSRKGKKENFLSNKSIFQSRLSWPRLFDDHPIRVPQGRDSEYSDLRRCCR